MLLSLLRKKLNVQLLSLSTFFVFLFAILYYLQDRFIVRYKDFAKKIGLLDKDYSEKDFSDHDSSFLYYLWYSLITQTTVGYAGVVNAKTGVSVPFSKSPNNLYRILNILQLFSVLFVVYGV